MLGEPRKMYKTYICNICEKVIPKIETIIVYDNCRCLCLRCEKLKDNYESD